MCVTKATTRILLQQCDQQTVNKCALALVTDNSTTVFFERQKKEVLVLANGKSLDSESTCTTNISDIRSTEMYI